MDTWTVISFIWRLFLFFISNAWWICFLLFFSVIFTLPYLRDHPKFAFLFPAYQAKKNKNAALAGDNSSNGEKSTSYNNGDKIGKSPDNGGYDASNASDMAKMPSSPSVVTADNQRNDLSPSSLLKIFNMNISSSLSSSPQPPAAATTATNATPSSSKISSLSDHSVKIHAMSTKEEVESIKKMRRRHYVSKICPENVVENDEVDKFCSFLYCNGFQTCFINGEEINRTFKMKNNCLKIKKVYPVCEYLFQHFPEIKISKIDTIEKGDEDDEIVIKSTRGIKTNTIKIRININSTKSNTDNSSASDNIFKLSDAAYQIEPRLKELSDLDLIIIKLKAVMQKNKDDPKYLSDYKYFGRNYKKKNLFCKLFD